MIHVRRGKQDGRSYTAPIPGGRMMTLFVTDPAIVREGRRVDASSMRLDRLTGDGWLAVGAATALDPLSSHGLGSAMAGAIEAARALLIGSFARYGEDRDDVDELRARAPSDVCAGKALGRLAVLASPNQHRVDRARGLKDTFTCLIQPVTLLPRSTSPSNR